jgi:mono/diheme cytochrome c family protein
MKIGLSIRNMKLFLFIGFLVFTILIQGVHAQSLLHPSDSRVVSQGSLIYKQYCASCHGRKLEGERNWRSRLPDGTLPAPPHDESGHTWHHPDKLLFALTKKGTEKFVGGNYKSKMLGFEGILTDAQIVAVLSYIKSRWSEKVRKRHDQINKRSLESK